MPACAIPTKQGTALAIVFFAWNAHHRYETYLNDDPSVFFNASGCNGTWAYLDPDCARQIRSAINATAAGWVTASYMICIVFLLLSSFMCRSLFAFISCGDPMNDYERL